MPIYIRPDSLVDAINELTSELRAGREERRVNFATKSDLKAMETRIINALQGASSGELKKIIGDLKASTDPLEAAVKANQPT